VSTDRGAEEPEIREEAKIVGLDRPKPKPSIEVELRAGLERVGLRPEPLAETVTG
jgi:hypothetical protein